MSVKQDSTVVSLSVHQTISHICQSLEFCHGDTMVWMEHVTIHVIPNMCVSQEVDQSSFKLSRKKTNGTNYVQYQIVCIFTYMYAFLS